MIFFSTALVARVVSDRKKELTAVIMGVAAGSPRDNCRNCSNKYHSSNSNTSSQPGGTPSCHRR